MNPESRRGQGRQLSPELAERNPEEYKRFLLEHLKSDTKLTGAVWDRYAAQGAFDDRTIVLRSNTWMSEMRRRPGTEKFSITLGTKPFTAAEREYFLFETELDDKTYLLSHEISHLFAANAAEEADKVSKLYQTVTAMRRGGRGLSALGSLNFYKTIGPEEQAKEDMVELFNMHLIDPDYLTRYLKFLSDPRYAAERSRVGISEIKPPVAELINRTVTDATSTLLSS